MKMTVEVNNTPNYAETYPYIVARLCDDGELWFYGAYETESEAKDVAFEITGLVLYNERQGVADMSIVEMMERVANTLGDEDEMTIAYCFYVTNEGVTNVEAEAIMNMMLDVNAMTMNFDNDLI